MTEVKYLAENFNVVRDALTHEDSLCHNALECVLHDLRDGSDRECEESRCTECIKKSFEWLATVRAEGKQQ